MLHKARRKTAYLLYNLLPLALLVGLLLFSSCKLRAPLQAYFQSPVTASLNVSKATVGTQAPCRQVVSEATPTSSFQKKHHLLPILAGLPQEEAMPAPNAALQSISPYFARRSISGDLPLYILYRKMKLAC